MELEGVHIDTTLLDHMPVGVYCLDRHRRITYWNEEARRLTGYPGREVCGRSCADDILTTSDEGGRCLCDSACPVLATLNDGQIREASVYLHHKDGQRVPMVVKVLPVLDSQGAITGTVQVFTENASVLATREKLKQYQALALTDPLTGLPNRARLDAEQQRFHDELRRTGRGYGVAMVDIDHFKRCNDQYGHMVGDEVLKMVGKTLVHACRSYDLLGRWGGEEFMGLLALEGEGDPQTVSERMRSLVEQSYLVRGGRRLAVTISVGVARAMDDEPTSAVVTRADRALYHSKHSGRNCVTAVMR